MHTDPDQTGPDEGPMGVQNEDDTGDPYLVEDFMAFAEEKRLNGERIDWFYWLVSMPKLTAAEAARLMSALDPYLFADLNEGPTKGHLVDDAAENVVNIQRLAERQGKVEATASEWLEWAGKSCFPVHIGYRLNLVRLAEGKPDQAAEDAPSQGETNILNSHCHASEIHGIEVGEQIAGIKVKHLLERKIPNSGDSLTPVVWEICYDLHESNAKVTAAPVMGVLRKMADEKTWPLVSIVDGGVKFEYEKGEESELNGDALRKRIDEWKVANGLKTGG